MKIVVIGGSGLIGSRVVTLLGAAGHQVLAASPRTGVNTITGEGLTDALTDADVVVDVANAPSWEPQAVLDFFRTSARNLGKAEVAAGVRHHVALSIVGCDRMPENGYFAAKVAQEQAIEAAGVPYTIVRATQFMEFIGGIADFGTEGGTVRIGDGLFQPIAAEDVAVLLAQIALAGPLNGTVEIAGPDRAPFAEIVARYLKAVGDARAVVTDRDASYYGGRIEETSLVPLGPVRLGRIGLDQWLARS
ncbi:NmrA family transcriptional regulator [Burkholderia ubonensis]|uniref:SDR family oxidoreductase n=1 Tax=Burkholderia ubonensis TaxID=101571 RepID=UPI00075BA412|nr:SDR family oxidoreductase [Burkholderia ubonensis]KVO71967.1 NmrA family transcriptional regulator [Burkholderia ubonensis]KVP83776.1 NmrA family transcriptional regulator [Burkholderia ubonensis]KVR21057.1 NmrA family transcriptional regulator [Burkholderia ubonensis]KWB92004.1 NmrA family transcriptional regulator [Burkholderia ubonensis]KWI93659.1 NmrA family transcriptional regulator [Burkholderia ubonensis]